MHPLCGVRDTGKAVAGEMSPINKERERTLLLCIVLVAYFGAAVTAIGAVTCTLVAASHLMFPTLQPQRSRAGMFALLDLIFVAGTAYQLWWAGAVRKKIAPD